MCIVCEIKNKLAVSGATAEEQKFIAQRVEMLAACASHCHDVVSEVLDGTKQSRANLQELRKFGGLLFSDAPGAMESRAEAIAEREEIEAAMSEGFGGLAELLGELLGGKGASVRVVHVDAGNLDDLPEALRDIIKGGDRPTKH